METTYGVDVRNRFDLCFDDDIEDPLEILKQQEAEILKRKNEKVSKDKPKHARQQQPASVGPKSKKEVISNVPSKASVESVAKPQNRAPKTGGRLPERAGTYEDKNRRNVEPVLSSEGQWDSEPRRGRGGSRGGRGISRGRPGGYDQRGKREFDRQSGSTKSGVKPVEKREGGGAHNWGTVADDIQFPDNPDTEERSSDEGPPQGGDAKETDVPAKAKEPEEVEMTLDEWKMRERSKRLVPVYNLRKPGEGETEKKWGRVYVLKKKDVDEEDEEEDEDYDDEEVVKRGRQKQHLDIEIRFEDMNLRGRGRGRGFGRGGRGGRNIIGTGSDAANRSTSNTSHLPAPKVDDFVDFPSLSNT